jgi:hypothetical protein
VVKVVDIATFDDRFISACTAQFLNPDAHHAMSSVIARILPLRFAKKPGLLAGLLVQPRADSNCRYRLERAAS